MTQLMRVAYVISTPKGVGGAERLMLDLISGGARQGVVQVVYNTFEPSKKGSELASLVDGVGVPYNKPPTDSNLLSSRQWLIHQLSNFSPDVVVALLPAAMALCATLPRRLASCWIASHQHGNHLHESNKRVKEIVDRAAGYRCDRVVACSEAVHEFLRTTYRYPARRVVTILNGWSGVPLERQSTNKPTIISVGRLREEKGHAELLRAFALVRTNIEADLVLVGDGPQFSTLRALARDIGVEGSVRFTGELPDVWPQLAKADVFALPSHHEALGIAVLEAMAAGLPVVASNVGGVPELVRDGKSGYLVPPKDAEALAAKLYELLSNPSLARSMGEAGLAIAASHRSETTAERYFSLFAGVLTGDQRSPRTG